MGSNLGIALLLGLVGAFAIYDYAIGTNYIFRPLVTGVLVGIVMGDVRQGTIIGASLELMFMGAVSVGAYIPPDIVTGGILGTAFAIGLGKDTGIAMALALPISMIALVVNNLKFMYLVNSMVEEADFEELGKAHKSFAKVVEFLQR